MKIPETTTATGARAAQAGAKLTYNNLSLNMKTGKEGSQKKYFPREVYNITLLYSRNASP